MTCSTEEDIFRNNEWVDPKEEEGGEDIVNWWMVVSFTDQEEVVGQRRWFFTNFLKRYLMEYSQDSYNSPLKIHKACIDWEFYHLFNILYHEDKISFSKF